MYCRVLHTGILWNPIDTYEIRWVVWGFFCYFRFEVLLAHWTSQEPQFDNLRFLYWTLSGPGPFVFVYLSCLGIFVDRNLPRVIWDVLGVAQHSHHRVVHLAKSQKLPQDHKRSPKIFLKTVQSHQRGSPQEVIFLHKVAFFFSPSLVNFNFTKLCLLC